MISKLYSNFILNTVEKKIDLSQDTIKGMLVTSVYTPNQISHALKSDVTGEVTTSSYPAGGVALTGVSITIDPITGAVTLFCDNIDVSSLTATYRCLVLYDVSGNYLIGYVDFGADQVIVDTDDWIEVPSTGLITITV